VWLGGFEMRKFISLLLAVSFLGMNCVPYKQGKGIKLEPGQTPGANLVIEKTDGQKERGELIAVIQNSLLLMERDSGLDVTINIKEIHTIEIVKNSNELLWAVLIGGGIGALLGFGMGGEWVPRDEVTLKMGAIGVAFGMFAVTFAGEKNDLIQIAGKSDDEIAIELGMLRSKARYYWY
jgi:hypothetical protein